MKKFSEIIIEGQKAGKTVEEINTELKKAGATFHFETMDEAMAKAKELKEQEEGFMKGEEPMMIDGQLAMMASDGKPIKLDGEGAAVKTPTMARDKSRAGTTITVGKFKLTYDENGYCTKKSRI